MARSDLIEFQDCEVVECLPAAKFKVKLPNGGIALATVSGQLRMNKIHIIVGDKVTINISPYDVQRGIITWRSAATDSM